MKKFIFIFLMIFIAKNSWANSIVQLTIPDTVAIPVPESSVQIPINVSDVTGLSIMGYQFHITFNDSILRFNGLNQSNTLSETWSMYSNDSQSNNIFIGGYGETLSGAGTLIYLTFDVIGDCGDTTDLSFEDFLFNEGNPEANYTTPLATMAVRNLYDLNCDNFIDILDVQTTASTSNFSLLKLVIQHFGE